MVHPECGMSVYLIVWFIQVQSQVISLQISHLQFDDIMCITATQTLFIQHSQLLWPWHFARFNCWKLPRIQISCEISSITDSADLQEYNWITFICITVLKKERVVQKPEKSEDKKFGDIVVIKGTGLRLLKNIPPLLCTTDQRAQTYISMHCPYHSQLMMKSLPQLLKCIRVHMKTQ